MHKNRMKNLCLILVSIVMTFLVLETVLRFTPYRHLLARDQHLKDYYGFDPAKGYDIRSNVKNKRQTVDNRLLDYDIWSNELGCFDEPYRGENDVILLVGDSFTHCFAPFQDKWGTRLEGLLDYRVLKCGVTGYGTKQELLKAREIIGQISHPPRLILVGYFWNDIADDALFPNFTVADGLLVPAAAYRDQSTGAWNLQKLQGEFSFWDKISSNYPLSFKEMIKYFLGRHLITLNLIDDALMKKFPAKYSYPDPLQFWIDDPEAVKKAWPHHRENLKAFRRLAMENNAKLLVVLIPSRTQVYPFLSGRQEIDLLRPNGILGQFLTEEGIDYIDLLPLFRSYADQRPRKFLSSEKDLFYRYSSHWSPKGEYLAALLVARHILQRDLVQVNEKAGKLKRLEEQLKTSQENP